jgi:hypothetical protein
MNRTIIILLLILIYSCKTENKEKIKSTEIKSVELKNTENSKQTELTEFIADTINIGETIKENIDSLKIQEVFNFDYIKSKTKELSKEISISYNLSNKNENFIPKDFLEKFISPKKVQIGFPESLPADYPESYSFRESKEHQDFNIFTFSYDDESCCTTLYAATTKKDTLDIINIGVIAYSGGDAGWVGEKYGEWTNDFLISNIEPSEYDEPAPEEPMETEIDTIWSEIKILKDGTMKYSETRNVKYLGKKKIE